MSKSNEDTLLELDDILNDGGNEERLNAFLRRKGSKQPKKKSAFEGFQMAPLNFEVKFVNREKAQNTLVNEQTKKSPLHDICRNAEIELPVLPSVSPAASDPLRFSGASLVHENMPPRSVSVSPHGYRSPYNALRCNQSFKGSDRLRRVAIRRRSQSNGGRRQLLKEFENLTNLTRTSTSMDFLPGISSTPSTNPTKENTMPIPAVKDVLDNYQQSFQQHLQLMCRNANNPTAQASETRPSSRTSTRLSQNPPSRPSTPETAKRRTYVIEKGPMPGQLLLSPSTANLAEPSAKNVTDRESIREDIVRVRRDNLSAIRNNSQHEILAPDTPGRDVGPSPGKLLCRTDIYVPETQPMQALDNVGDPQGVLTPSASLKGPVVVIPITCQSNAAQPADLTTTETAKPAALMCMNRSIQTSNARLVENFDEIMTDDEDSDDKKTNSRSTQRHESTAPLNLAPPGGNTTRQRRLRKRNQPQINESSMLLLNLHRTAAKNSSQKRKTHLLNKAPSVPINGEQFALELQRMSNYEILDLRKRNSQGKIALIPLNGHKSQQNKEMKHEQKLAIEESIQWEMLRRNLRGESEGLPTTISQAPEPNESSASTRTSMPPPAPKNFRDSRCNASSSTLGNLSSRQNTTAKQTKRSARLRRRDMPVTKELENYLGISQAIAKRLETRTSTKRSLYNKGDSDVGYDDPESHPRLSSFRIVPAPPSNHGSSSVDAINIVPPPPARRSVSMPDRRQSVSTAATEVDELIKLPPLNAVRLSRYSQNQDVLLRTPPPEFARRSGFMRIIDNEPISPPPEYVRRSESMQVVKSEPGLPPPVFSAPSSPMRIVCEEPESKEFARRSNSMRTMGNEPISPPPEYIRRSQLLRIVNEEPELTEVAAHSNSMRIMHSVPTLPPPEFARHSESRQIMDSELTSPPPEFARRSRSTRIVNEEPELTEVANRSKAMRCKNSGPTTPPPEFATHSESRQFMDCKSTSSSPKLARRSRSFPIVNKKPELTEVARRSKLMRIKNSEPTTSPTELTRHSVSRRIMDSEPTSPPPEFATRSRSMRIVNEEPELRDVARRSKSMRIRNSETTTPPSAFARHSESRQMMNSKLISPPSEFARRSRSTQIVDEEPELREVARRSKSMCIMDSEPTSPLLECAKRSRSMRIVNEEPELTELARRSKSMRIMESEPTSSSPECAKRSRSMRIVNEEPELKEVAGRSKSMRSRNSELRTPPSAFTRHSESRQIMASEPPTPPPEFTRRSRSTRIVGEEPELTELARRSKSMRVMESEPTSSSPECAKRSRSMRIVNEEPELKEVARRSKSMRIRNSEPTTPPSAFARHSESRQIMDSEPTSPPPEFARRSRSTRIVDEEPELTELARRSKSMRVMESEPTSSSPECAKRSRSMRIVNEESELKEVGRRSKSMRSRNSEPRTPPSAFARHSESRQIMASEPTTPPPEFTRRSRSTRIVGEEPELTEVARRSKSMRIRESEPKSPLPEFGGRSRSMRIIDEEPELTEVATSPPPELDRRSSSMRVGNEEHASRQSEVTSRSKSMQTVDEPMSKSAKRSRSIRVEEESSQQSKPQASPTPNAQTVEITAAPADEVFKKPLGAAPRSKPRKSKLEKLKETLKIMNPNETLDITNIVNSGDTSLRRSRRGNVPIKHNWVHTVSDPFEFDFMRAQLSGRILKRQQEQKKQQSRQNTLSSVCANSMRTPLCSSTPRSTDVQVATDAGRDSSMRGKRKRQHQQQEPHCDGLDDIMEQDNPEPVQLRTELPVQAPTSTNKKKAQKTRAENTNSGVVQDDADLLSDKELRTKPQPRQQPQRKTKNEMKTQKPEPKKRERRKNQDKQEEQILEPTGATPASEQLPTADDTPSTSASVQKADQANQLMAWLRGVSAENPGSQIIPDYNETHFTTMNLSPAGNLVFTTMEGVDYAFYDTDDTATLGYMRFQPLQQRGVKRAKSYNLHFVVLFGEFAIENKANDGDPAERSILRIGDMIEIRKGTRYSMANILNEISVLMVFRR